MPELMAPLEKISENISLSFISHWNYEDIFIYIFNLAKIYMFKIH